MPKVEVKSKAADVDVRIIEVPMAEVTGSWSSAKVETTFYREHGMALRKLRQALDNQQATLRSGQRVTSLSNAVRWLLEQIDGA